MSPQLQWQFLRLFLESVGIVLTDIQDVIFKFVFFLSSAIVFSDILVVRLCLQSGWPQTWKTWNTQGFLWTWKTQGILCNLRENVINNVFLVRHSSIKLCCWVIPCQRGHYHLITHKILERQGYYIRFFHPRSWASNEQSLVNVWHGQSVVMTCYIAGVNVEWPLMKVIITFTLCCDHQWKSKFMALEKPEKLREFFKPPPPIGAGGGYMFFLLPRGHPVSILLFVML